VDAAVRTDVVIAGAPLTGADRQQNFIDRDHTSPNISISIENDNARDRRNQTAGETSAPNYLMPFPTLPPASRRLYGGAVARPLRSPAAPKVKSVSRLTGINCGGRKNAYHGAYGHATSP
jgi:hypothetical protein